MAAFLSLPAFRRRLKPKDPLALNLNRSVSVLSTASSDNEHANNLARRAVVKSRNGAGSVSCRSCHKQGQLSIRGSATPTRNQPCCAEASRSFSRNSARSVALIDSRCSCRSSCLRCFWAFFFCCLQSGVQRCRVQHPLKIYTVLWGSKRRQTSPKPEPPRVKAWTFLKCVIL